MARVQGEVQSHEDFVAALRNVPDLREKGKVRTAFYFRSRPFLHFHGEDQDLCVDVRFGDEWERRPAATPAQRRRILDDVRRHVALAHR